VLAALCRSLRLDLVDLLDEVRDDVVELRSSIAPQRARRRRRSPTAAQRC
jgi:hypothetical protein